MDDSFGGFNQTNAAEGKSENKAEGTLPVFIKQIMQQEDDVVTMWGFEYKMITTVALVRNIDHSSTKTTYRLEDLTGTVNAHIWVDEGDTAPNGIMLNTYVRVIGAVRRQGEITSIMIYKIHGVQGINEVNTHYLEVLNARYQAEEYFNGGTGANTSDKMETGSSLKVAQKTTATQDEPQGKSIAIFKAIQAGGGKYPDVGIGLPELASMFKQVSANELETIIDKLASEGHIYSSIDSNHFLACF